MSQKRHQPATRYCVNCGLSVGQCRDLFFSRCCRLSSSRGWTMAIRHSLAFHHISCHDCSQWWTPPLGLYFPHQSSSTSLLSFVRLQSGLHSNMQSSCTSVYTGSYLTDELCQVADIEACQRLHSTSSSSLIVSRTRLPTVGDRALLVTIARVWNSLPDLVTSAPSVAVFQSRHKT